MTPLGLGIVGTGNIAGVGVYPLTLVTLDVRGGAIRPERGAVDRHTIGLQVPAPRADR